MSKQCRICLEENEDLDDLFSPCSCNGTQKYVHKKCLERWRQENIDNDNYDRCQECRTEYKTKEISKKCFCLKWHIRLFHRFFNKSSSSIFINLLLMFGVGLLGNIIFKILHLNLNFFEIDEYIFINLNIGNFLISGFFLVFYSLLSIINYFNNDFNFWVSSNYLNIHKIHTLFLLNLLFTLLIPYLGFFFGIFILHLNAVFFIEYFFGNYLVDKTQVIDLPKEDNITELSELLIEN